MKILSQEQLNNEKFMKKHFGKSGLEKLKRAKKEFLGKNEKFSAGKVTKLIKWGKKDGNIANYAFLYSLSPNWLTVEETINNAYTGYLERAKELNN